MDGIEYSDFRKFNLGMEIIANANHKIASQPY